MRKSVLGMLYGKYVRDGKVDLQKTVVQLKLQDRSPFLPIEENATLEMLLMSRSGIYQFDVEEGLNQPPRNGSQYPGTFFSYQNWDFDAAGTAFEKLTGRSIYDALETDLARPLGLWPLKIVPFVAELATGSFAVERPVDSLASTVRTSNPGAALSAKCCKIRNTTRPQTLP